MVVVSISEFEERGAQFLEIGKATNPQQLLFEGAKEPLDASIVALLVAILVNQRSQQVVHAQGSIEYKVVDTPNYVTPDGKVANPSTTGAKYLTTQDALDEYGKAGWQLVTESFHRGWQRGQRTPYCAGSA